MNRKQIEELQAIRAYPSLSIISPTHRTAPDNLQDPIRVKNMVREGVARLMDEFSLREAGPLIERLDSLVEEIDWNYTLDGVALFANCDFATRLDLPFPVRERVLLDEGFATRDLVFALNRSPRYWVLVLSEQPTRLYEATRDRLQESRLGKFPIEHQGPGGATAMPGGHGVQQSATRDEYDRKFFRQVDAELSQVLAADPLPVVVTGVTRNLAFWDKVSKHKSHIAGTLEGSHDSTSAHDLGQLAWPVMQDFMAQERAQVLEELGEAVGAKQHAAGMGEVWQMAQQGRGEVLVVEEGFHYPAQLHPSGLLMPAEEGAPDSQFMGDAVDELVECVLAKSGRVVFVQDGALREHARIAMILRW
jgi:hypothetical protein